MIKYLTLIALTFVCNTASAECSDEAYIDFLRKYLKSMDEGLLPERPCPTTEKGYLALFQQWERHWKAADKDHGIDQAESKTLMALAAAKPKVAGIAAYAKWSALHQAALDQASRIIIEGNIVKQRAFEVNEEEDLRLKIVEAMRPAVDDERAYVVWFTTRNRYAKRIFESLDYRRRHVLSDAERRFLDRVALSLPKGHGDKAYLTWLQQYVPLVKEVAENGDVKVKDRIDRLLAAKPCSAGAKSLAAHGRLSKLTPKMGDNARYISEATPACTP